MSITHSSSVFSNTGFMLLRTVNRLKCLNLLESTISFAPFKIKCACLQLFFKSINLEVVAVLITAFLGAIFYAPNWVSCYPSN